MVASARVKSLFIVITVTVFDRACGVLWSCAYVVINAPHFAMLVILSRSGDGYCLSSDGVSAIWRNTRSQQLQIR
jgi:hypothetical protein